MKTLHLYKRHKKYYNSFRKKIIHTELDRDTRLCGWIIAAEFEDTLYELATFSLDEDDLEEFHKFDYIIIEKITRKVRGTRLVRIYKRDKIPGHYGGSKRIKTGSYYLFVPKKGQYKAGYTEIHEDYWENIERQVIRIPKRDNKDKFTFDKKKKDDRYYEMRDKVFRLLIDLDKDEQNKIEYPDTK